MRNSTEAPRSHAGMHDLRAVPGKTGKDGEESMRIEEYVQSQISWATNDKPDRFEPQECEHFGFPCKLCKHRMGPVDYCRHCRHWIK